MEIIPATDSKSLNEDNTFDNYLLTVDAYSKITKLYGMKNTTTEEVMDKLYMFQAKFGKVDEFGWWDMERIKTDAGMQFTSKEFQEGLSVREGQLASSAPKYQEMNGQVEVTWRTLQSISHSIMVHARVSDKYIYIALMYMTDHI